MAPAARRGAGADRGGRGADRPAATPVRAVRRPWYQRPRRAVREVPDGDRPPAARRAGVTVDDDRLRRPPAAGRRGDGRGQPVRRLTGPGAVDPGRSRAGCADAGGHQQSGVRAGLGGGAAHRRARRAGAGGCCHQVLYRPAARPAPAVRGHARPAGQRRDPAARARRTAARRGPAGGSGRPALPVRPAAGHHRPGLLLPDRAGGGAQANGDLLHVRPGVLRGRPAARPLSAGRLSLSLGSAGPGACPRRAAGGARWPRRGAPQGSRLCPSGAVSRGR
jgi:hypothetical protein